MYCPKMKPYVKYHKMFLYGMGHWPYQTIKTRRIVRFVSGTALLSYCVPLGVRFYEARNDFDDFLECLPMAVTAILIAWCYFLFFVIKGNHLLELLNQMSNDFDKLQSLEAEFKILKESTEEGRFAAIAFIVYTIISSIAYCGITLLPIILDIVAPLNESRPLSYISEVDYIFFERNDHYVFSYFHSGIIGCFSVMQIVAADVMLYLFVQHACGMFRVLRYRLKTITNTLDKGGDSWKDSIQENDIYKNAVFCAKMYQNILEFSDSIDSCFSMVLILGIGVTIVLLSFQGTMVMVILEVAFNEESSGNLEFDLELQIQGCFLANFVFLLHGNPYF
ncbi:uncharacterized protein LOC117173730 [Belonocnema kinseyi]|uniref:uncharacterized protein LOC117173730 n=1 Tax=Belonocnema kinseyi TaxID=2817044 RepID=UPI00143DE68A|nr:uncharacterized protein LOC117173730 [Belonocnema kinseyi]